MRVIAGDLKGRKIKAVPGKSTRPTADKIKESLFQVIGPFFNGGFFLDLFAGSGSLGIEALSRGMDRGIFIDKHPKAIYTVRENIEQMQLEERTEIFRADAFRALKACSSRELQFDLILLDPPYRQMNYEKILEEIMGLSLIKQEGIIYCEHDPSEYIPELDGLSVVKKESYSSSIAITIFKYNNKF